MKELEVPQVPEWGEANKPRVVEFLELLDRELKTRPFIAGERFTVADITAMVAFDFIKVIKLTTPDLPDLKRWHAEVSARPSARA
jgi:glutathione S-transferase